MIDKLKILIDRYSKSKDIEKKNNALLRSRKEVEINGSGTHGYRIKEGIHKGKVIGHVIREKSPLSE
jgi:hypothetical protein